MDVLTSHVNERPEELVGALMASPAGAVVVARIAEKAGALERAQAPAADSVPSPAESVAGGFVDLILTAIETGSELQILGFELTDSQRAQVRARAAQSPRAAARGALDVDGLVEAADGGGEYGTPVPSTHPVTSSRARARGSERPVSPPNATRVPAPSPEYPPNEGPVNRFRSPEPEQVPAPDILAQFLVAERRELGLEPDDGNDDREIQSPKQGRFEHV